MSDIINIKKYKDDKLAKKIYEDLKTIIILIQKCKVLLSSHNKYRAVQDIVSSLNEKEQECTDTAHNLLIYLRGDNNDNIKEAKKSSNNNPDGAA